MVALTFIFVTYNSEQIIDLALSKIKQEKYKIIISDNGSTDNTIQIIKQKYPNITLIENKKNIGFARANNIAFKQVKTDLFALINPDCFIDDNSILELIKVINLDNKIALAGARAYGAKLNSKYNITNVEADLIAKKNYIGEEELYFIAKFISGCFMLGKTNVFKKIGLFDDGFFLYCEDNELCKRIYKENYKIIVAKNSKQIHLSRNSTQKIDNNMIQAINWHRFGYSKCYYTECVYNKFIAKLKALRNLIKVALIFIFKIMTFKKLNNKEIALISGSFAYLIGQSAFTKNGNPRKF